jgi:broad specificity phosphatase PhoE
MEIIIFRHGETDWNKEKKLQGHCNIPLNESGVSQARELAIKLQAENLDVIFSSDLSRAKETASIVAELSGLSVEFDTRLREKSFGKAEGLKLQEVVQTFGQEHWDRFRDCSEDSWDFCFAGGETRRQCLNRVLDVFDEVSSLNQYKKIGISTHGGVIRSLMAYAKVLDASTVKVGNCHHFEISFKGRDQLIFTGLD